MKTANLIIWLAKCTGVLALVAAIVVAFSSGFYFGYLDGYYVGHGNAMKEHFIRAPTADADPRPHPP